MLFHASMRASDPARVARVLAEIWQGGVVALPPEMFEGDTYVAFARDERGTQIEVMPLDFAFVPPAQRGVVKTRDTSRTAQLTSVHFAIASPLDEAAIRKIALREGWESVTDWRALPGGGYGVVEVWLENRMMIEVLTPEMQRQYGEFMRRIPQVIPPLATG